MHGPKEKRRLWWLREFSASIEGRAADLLRGRRDLSSLPALRAWPGTCGTDHRPTAGGRRNPLPQTGPGSAKHGTNGRGLASTRQVSTVPFYRSGRLPRAPKASLFFWTVHGPFSFLRKRRKENGGCAVPTPARGRTPPSPPVAGRVYLPAAERQFCAEKPRPAPRPDPPFRPKAPGRRKERPETWPPDSSPAAPGRRPDSAPAPPDPRW